MTQDTQIPEEQHKNSTPHADDSVLPPDLLEEVNALRKKVDTLDNALNSVVKNHE